MSRPTVTWYTIYLAASDEIAACGTAEDCVRALGLSSIAVFHSIMWQRKAARRMPKRPQRQSWRPLVQR